MATITPQSATPAGVALTFAAAGGSGDLVQNNKLRTVVLVKNGSGAPINVTVAAVQTQRPADGNFPAQTVADQVVSVAAGATAALGPFPAAFNNSSGQLAVSYSATTTVTVAALEVI